MCARLDDCIAYDAPFWGPYNSTRLYEQDEKIGNRGKPGARYMKWQLNSLGYRGPDLRNGTIRIVCIGSSETFGLYEAEGEEYPRQLERDLNSLQGKNVFQVVNVAYPGESAAGSILRVPEISEEIQPSIAFIYTAPASYIDMDWIRSGAQVAAPDERSSRVDFRIADRFRAALKSLLPEGAQTWIRQREIKAAAARYHVLDRLPEENVRRYRSDLTELVSRLRTCGIEPILVTHADAFGEHAVMPDYQLLTSWRMGYPMLTESGFIDMEQRMNEAMRNLATADHIQLVDAAREIPPSRKYFADFAHFTTLGAALMASRLADAFYASMSAKSSKASALESGSSPH
jgi:lysophospholipase L1-like esterase